MSSNSYATPFGGQTAPASFYTAVLSGMSNVSYINPETSRVSAVMLPGFSTFGTKPSASVEAGAVSQVAMLSCDQSGQAGKACKSNSDCSQMLAPACPGIKCLNNKCSMSSIKK